MMLSTGVRPKSIFGFFDRCATRKGLKNPRLMAGSKSNIDTKQQYQIFFQKKFLDLNNFIILGWGAFSLANFGPGFVSKFVKIRRRFRFDFPHFWGGGEGRMPSFPH